MELVLLKSLIFLSTVHGNVVSTLGAQLLISLSCIPVHAAN